MRTIGFALSPSEAAGTAPASEPSTRPPTCAAVMREPGSGAGGRRPSIVFRPSSGPCDTSAGSAAAAARAFSSSYPRATAAARSSTGAFDGSSSARSTAAFSTPSGAPWKIPFATPGAK